MSGSSEPTRENIQTVQIWLRHLDGRSEAEPRQVLAESAPALPMLASWTGNDAYAWLLALRAKCFRLIDELPEVLAAVRTALAGLDGTSRQLAAQLHLEAGMALNQFDRQPEAADHLIAADRAFEQAGDAAGQAWALVSLAESYSGSGYPHDAEPLLTRAIELAESANDIRAVRRAWKQFAVVHRHFGRIAEALAAIQLALDGAPRSQVRANFVLELGHLLAWSNDFAGSDAAYEEAAELYAEFDDDLGLANVERAFATNALILGRTGEGLRRLDRAVERYRRIGGGTGLGYALRERSLVRLGAGDIPGALTDAADGVARFRSVSDTLGLAGMLRTAARVQLVAGDRDAANELLDEALALTADGRNPLAEAGAKTMAAELAEHGADMVAAATAAAELYRTMQIHSGVATALSLAARGAAMDGDKTAAIGAARQSAAALRLARAGVMDPGRRADNDFALRDVVTNLLTVATELADPAADRVAADLLLDATPLGLRDIAATGELGHRVHAFLRRVTKLPVRARPEPGAQRHLLQQLGALLTTLNGDYPPERLSFEQIAAARPSEGLLLLGAPTRDGAIPAVFTLPGEELRTELLVLDPKHVTQIDALGHATTVDRAEVLWNSTALTWQVELAEALLPAAVRRWLVAPGPVELSVILPPILAHLPIEALLVAGVPLGVRAAVTRLPVPTAKQPTPTATGRTVAYLDPALDWQHERAELPDSTDEPELLRAGLAPESLIVVACHGESAVRAEGALVSHGGDRVLDAIDILSCSLRSSTVVLEACFAGRYMGQRTGEQLNLASVCLLAGASAVVAGLFAVPADSACTGRITGALLRELRAGVPAAEALRRARAEYLHSAPDEVRLPGTSGGSMSGDAPWAWAGLCAYSR